jgi:hypothetical protein
MKKVWTKLDETEKQILEKNANIFSQQVTQNAVYQEKEKTVYRLLSTNIEDMEIISSVTELQKDRIIDIKKIYFYNIGMENLTEKKLDLAKDNLKKSAELGHCLAQSEYANLLTGRNWLMWTIKAAYNGSYEDAAFLERINPEIVKQEKAQDAFNWIKNNFVELEKESENETNFVKSQAIKSLIKKIKE